MRFRDFNKEVLREAILSALLTAISGMLIDLGIYWLLNSRGESAVLIRDAIQSCSFLVITVFCVRTLLQIQGVSLRDINAVRKHGREVVIGAGIGLITLAPALLFATSFHFVAAMLLLLPLIAGLSTVAAAGAQTIVRLLDRAGAVKLSMSHPVQASPIENIVP